MGDTILHGAETWTIIKSLASRKDAFEMLIYRRVLKMYWTAKITNEEVWRRMEAGREIVQRSKEEKVAGPVVDKE